MCDLKIQYCDENITVFVISDNEKERLYFLIYVPEDGVSEIYDSDLQKINATNIDDWFQVNTHQRYSHRSVLDMSVAFLNGLNSSYSLDDVEDVVRQSCDVAKDFLFHTDLISKYIKIYDIESADIGEISTAITNLRVHWDDILDLHGEVEFLNRLKRWIKHCRNSSPSDVSIFEKFVDRYYLTFPQLIPEQTGEPPYPNTIGYDKELKRKVLTNILIGQNKFKNISDELLRQVDELQIRRL